MNFESDRTGLCSQLIYLLALNFQASYSALYFSHGIHSTSQAGCVHCCNNTYAVTSPRPGI